MGDGWHNNHHRIPTSARHGLAWYEFDMTYRFIRLLARLRLAWDVKEPPAAVLAVARPDAELPASPGENPAAVTSGADAR